MAKTKSTLRIVQRYGPSLNSLENNYMAKDSPLKSELDFLSNKKATYKAELESKLELFPPCHEREELAKMLSRIFVKFPNNKVDLSIWTIAYYEDWIKQYDKLLSENRND